MNKKRNFKYENIKSNSKTEFDMNYRKMIHLIAHFQNCLQQMTAAHKAVIEKEKDSNNDT